MATAPFSLYVDTAAVSRIVKSGTAVTVTTNGSHNLVTGAYAQIELTPETALGTAVSGVYQVTVSSGTVFTYSAAGTVAGTVGSDETSTAVVALDLLNPPINYSSASRQQAVYVELASLNLSASGDGSSTTMNFTAMQDQTPTLGPWWGLIPDDARVRLIKADTGTTPSSTFTDVYFHGIVSDVSARMNGSGQGNVADVSLDDVNVVLDRIAVAGQVAASDPGRVGSIARAGGTVTITLEEQQSTTWYAGLPITLSGFIGGNGTPWNGNFVVSSVARVANPTYGEPSLQVIKYLQAGSNDSSALSQDITTIARSGKSSNQIAITFSGGHGLTQPIGIGISNVIQSGGDGVSLAALINQRYQSSSVRITNSTTLTVTLARAVTNWHTLSGGFVFSLDARAVVTDQQDGPVVGIPPGRTESQVVELILSKVNTAKAGDRFLQKLFSTGVTTGIAATTNTNALPIALPAGSLRSMLDATIEAFQGQDSRVRRYHISIDRKLNYTPVDSVAKPTYATAPYSIITTGAGSPNTTTAKATVAPYSLTANYQHATTKGAVINTTTSGPTTVSYLTYTQTGYAARKGPIFDDTIEFASPSASSPSALTRRFATSFFLERNSPLLVGSFELRGAGTAAHNIYGFSAGYAQTGASTFALVSRWKPGQWVEVVAAPLGLNGLYTVEAVDWSLEPGSFTQIIRVTFNRKSPATLTAVLATMKG